MVIFINITYRDLFNALRGPQRSRQLNPSSISNRSFLCDYIKQNIKYSIDEHYEAALNTKILAYTTTLNRKWLAVNRTASTFISKYEDWLDTKFDLPKKEKKAVDFHGRPSKPFSDLSERAKIRKVKPLVETISPDRLLRVTRVSLFKEGKHAAADLLKQSTENSPSRPAKIRKTFRESLVKDKIVPYTVDEALAHMVNCHWFSYVAGGFYELCIPCSWLNGYLCRGRIWVLT
ncbi:hypothetical protein QTP88_015470 [Uroleucon formosanum]